MPNDFLAHVFNMTSGLGCGELFHCVVNHCTPFLHRGEKTACSDLLLILPVQSISTAITLIK